MALELQSPDQLADKHTHRAKGEDRNPVPWQGPQLTTIDKVLILYYPYPRKSRPTGPHHEKDHHCS